ncbi:MAG: NADH-quinone oxidoreductase subunit J family protein [Acidimicrobiales bacterium]
MTVFPAMLLASSATLPDRLVFVVAALAVLSGAFGVVLSRNPVHAALMLVMTLFGVAVLFVEQQANFLAAVQVIVYAGAIVVLFLFVIMFLGVDRQEDLSKEPLMGQRPLAVAVILLGLGGLIALGVLGKWSVGAHAVAGPSQGQAGGDVAALGRSVFTTYLFPFEATAALLVIAVVGAVVLARRPQHGQGAVEADVETPGEAGGSSADGAGAEAAEEVSP